MEEITDYLKVCRDEEEDGEPWIGDDGVSSDHFADWIENENGDGGKMPKSGEGKGNRNALGRAVKAVPGLALIRKKYSQNRYIVHVTEAVAIPTTIIHTSTSEEAC